MKRILLFASALAGLFLAGCQRENLEPVQAGQQVTFTIEAPAAMQTKTIADGQNVNQLVYEVWLTPTLGNLETGAQKLYQATTEMVSDGTTNKAELTLDLVNDQKFTVLFWAQVEDTYDTEELTAVGYKNLAALKANDENLAAFYGVAYVKDGRHVKVDESSASAQVSLKRPFAQLNLCTLNTSTAYRVVMEESEVIVSNVPTVFNVVNGVEDVTSYKKVEFDMAAVPSDPETINVNNQEYQYAGMNYMFAGDNITLEYNIKTKLNDQSEAVVNNIISDVPLKENHRTNIVGNLLTSKTDYEIIVDASFIEPAEVVEVVTVSTAAELVEAINGTSTNEGEETNIKLEGDINLSDLFASLTRAATEEPKNIEIPAGKEFTLDLNGYSITGVDESTGSFGLINNRGNLTITNSSSNTSRIALVATENRGWNAYSSVISNNPGGNLLLKGNVLIEHLGGTDMAYGIDNLTNGKGTSAIVTVEGATVKSTYRAIRQFLNGIEATNELYVKDGSKIYGPDNKSIWMQDPSKNANTGKLVVEAGAELYGDVYLTVTAGSTEWPVEVSIADAALQAEYTVLTSNVPDKYELVNSNGVWTVETSMIEEGEVITVYSVNALKKIAAKVNAGENYYEGKTIKLGADIDLNNEEWIPIGSAVKDHGFMGNFDGNGYAIKNLKMTNLTPDADNYVYAGLFGVTEGTSTTQQNYIKNLVIENVKIQTEGHIAAAAIAYPYYTVVENVTVKGDISIKGGDYTSGALAYTRRCVNAKDITVAGNEGSLIEGNSTVGGVISDIQTNGGLTADYSTFKASGLTIKATKCVGGISGIIGGQTLDGAIVENVTLASKVNDNRIGIISGAGDSNPILKNVSYENVQGATRLIGGTYKGGYYFGQILEVAGVKAIVYSIENGVKAVSVEELNLKGKYWQDAIDWAARLGEGWALASMEELNAIYDARFELNDALEVNSKDNALFWEGDEYYRKNGSVYYALYMSSTEVPVGGADANGNNYFENRVFFKIFNKLGYSDVLYSAFDCINKYAPLRDNHFARATYTLQ